MREAGNSKLTPSTAARLLAPVTLFLALITACAPGAFDAPPQTPAERLQRDIRYCHSGYPNYQSAKKNYGSAASATVVGLYEHRCVYITLPPVRSYQELLFMYEQGIL